MKRQEKHSTHQQQKQHSNTRKRKTFFSFSFSLSFFFFFLFYSIDSRLLRQTNDGRSYMYVIIALALSLSLSFYTHTFISSHLIRLRHINEDVQWTLGVIIAIVKKRNERNMCSFNIFPSCRSMSK